MKHPLSVCIITYNEEENIRQCLEAVKWAEEIVVVDSHSTDNTVKICEEYKCKIILREFPGHIEQKNFAIDQAQHNWILSVDGDEVVTPELQEEIRKILSLPEILEKGFEILRINDYLGEWAFYAGFYPDYKLRLFHRNFGRWGGINPHDHILLEGKKGRISRWLLHYTYKDLSHHANVVNNFTSIAARQNYEKRKSFPMLKAFSHGIGRFLYSFFWKKGIFYGPRGLILSVMNGYYGFMKYAKLWELYEKDKKKK